MVAYSFKAQFEEPIATRVKCQTVRGERKRHARPGEPIQLYVAMRTKYCRKIITPDPVCIDVRPIDIFTSTGHPKLISSIEIAGVKLNDDEIEAFAIADGFGSALANGFARQRMGEFWLKNHPWQGFVGVVIRWKER